MTDAPNASTGREMALEGRVQQLESALAQYDELLSELADGIERLTPQAPGAAKSSGSTNGWTVWRAEQALLHARMDELRPWVAWLNDTIAEAHCPRRSPLPPCWEDHPGAVEELLALHAAWCAAYLGDRDNDAMTAWHDRWVGPALNRVLNGYALSSCQSHKCRLARSTGAPK